MAKGSQLIQPAGLGEGQNLSLVLRKVQGLVGTLRIRAAARDGNHTLPTRTPARHSYTTGAGMRLAWMNMGKWEFRTMRGQTLIANRDMICLIDKAVFEAYPD